MGGKLNGCCGDDPTGQETDGLQKIDDLQKIVEQQQIQIIQLTAVVNSFMESKDLSRQNNSSQDNNNPQNYPEINNTFLARLRLLTDYLLPEKDFMGTESSCCLANIDFKSKHAKQEQHRKS